MNSTPSDADAGPYPDGAASAAPSDAGVGGDQAVPVPRPGPRPLPRRVRSGTAARRVPDQEGGYDPDGRPFDRVDEETLSRLLSGLRDV
jgi:hypothetical protein